MGLNCMQGNFHIELSLKLSKFTLGWPLLKSGQEPLEMTYFKLNECPGQIKICPGTHKIL